MCRKTGWYHWLVFIPKFFSHRFKSGYVRINNKPDYFITMQKMTDKVDDYILEIQSKHDCITLKKSLSELSKDKELIAKFNPIDANRIGYMAGVCETVMEYQNRNQQILGCDNSLT